MRLFLCSGHSHTCPRLGLSRKCEPARTTGSSVHRGGPRPVRIVAAQDLAVSRHFIVSASTKGAGGALRFSTIASLTPRRNAAAIPRSPQSSAIRAARVQLRVNSWSAFCVLVITIPFARVALWIAGLRARLGRSPPARHHRLPGSPMARYPSAAHQAG